ncbi:MAG: hypothetical protein EKK54_01445 [Neisseriaceae bacterium]|nr:MAG: hypothetical protein EKK54_01445 [Neisseriaceae bacterium]
MNTDEQILQDGWYGRETEADSGINEEEQDDVAPESTQEVEEETDEVQETESDEDGEDSEPEQKKVEDTQPKKKSNSNFAKILAERNALRRQLQEKIDSYDKESMKDIESLIEERAERKIEEKLFFRDNPQAKELADELRSVASEHNMDIETAYKFYTSVIDPQTVAKSEAKKL